MLVVYQKSLGCIFQCVFFTIYFSLTPYLTPYPLLPTLHSSISSLLSSHCSSLHSCSLPLPVQCSLTPYFSLLTYCFLFAAHFSLFYIPYYSFCTAYFSLLTALFELFTSHPPFTNQYSVTTSGEGNKTLLTPITHSKVLLTHHCHHIYVSSLVTLNSALQLVTLDCSPRLRETFSFVSKEPTSAIF